MNINIRIKARVLLTIFLFELFSPHHLLALTSGPSQPEMASFTPFGTTEMVDPFTGDFTYNIPLMDVEGYPINIAYNSGITMEQEASWVGLGWNLNVGSINRSVRGLPDDFKGDQIVTTTQMKPQEVYKIGGGIGVEVFGSEKIGGKLVKDKLGLNASAGLSFIYNNYKGFGISTESSLGPSLNIGGLKANASVGYSLNTLDGASFNSSLGVKLDFLNGKNNGFSFGGSSGSGYSTRTGRKYLSFGTSAGYKQIDPGKGSSSSFGGGATFLPIGMETYTPYPTLKLQSVSSSFSGSVGGEIFGANGNINIHGSVTTQSLVNNGVGNSTSSYGYLYYEEAQDEDLLDFNREKSVTLNKTISNLSPVSATYDVYSVTGQGISGTFRPFRNDIATFHDPFYSESTAPDPSELGAEVGLGGYFHAGVNVNTIDVTSEYGAWEGGAHSNYKFRGNEINSAFEKVYFKAAGELTESDIDYFNNELGGVDALAFDLAGMNTRPDLKTSSGTVIDAFESKFSSDRQPRAKLFSYLTAYEAQYANNHSQIYSYTGRFYNSLTSTIDPLAETIIYRTSPERKPHHISRITQTNPNGDRYVYGIPAYNLSKKEYIYNTEQTPNGKRRVPWIREEASKDNDAGIDNYFSSTETPAYAHSYLLTEKQTVDYQDITGNGVSPDDAGNAWKFNYTRTSDDYHWRVPYTNSNFSEGFRTNDKDEKASYSEGVKELWYVHSIESKNQVAEFFISERRDGLGASPYNDAGGVPKIGGVLSIRKEDRSFKLDSIVLYNKYDRIKDAENAVPLKTIVFKYSYELCPNVQNQEIFGEGKLTLEGIEILHGGSRKGKLSPYVFQYHNRYYGLGVDNTDRWGNFKHQSFNPPGLINEEYPYVLQENTQMDSWASAWNLKEIITPSGGKIKIFYGSDDYAFVQDKRAMQMFPVLGAIDKSSNTFSTNNTLYGNHRLIIKKPSSVPIGLSTAELKRLFFDSSGGLDNMYFKFLTNITSAKEYVSGYTRAVDIGYCTDDSKLWVELEDISPNPISKISWDFFRQNLFDVLYKQPRINDSDLEGVLKGLAANVADIQQMFTGVENYLENRNIADDFATSESFIRLYSPSKSKDGGGSRVSRIELHDNWNNMASDGSNSVYGQTYDYTTTDELGNTISSGVATYEPFVGNDENPFRMPDPYVASGKSGHIPAIEAYQEEPFGESFFPAASVGYSKVTVKNIHADKGKSSNAITEHRFYTAKDFPVIVKETKIQKHNSPSTDPKMSFPFTNQINRSEFAASQGYSIILNDMHGKPRSTRTYTSEIINGNVIEKTISGTNYNYHHTNTPDGKMLDNQVQVLSSSGEVGTKLLGVEYDISIDSRRSYEATETRTDKANVDVFPAGGIFIFPIPIPTYFNHRIKDVSDARTVVLTKTVQMYGILESVENYTDQYSTTVFNRLYDGQTGEVLLTETQDEHKRNEFQFSVPANLISGLQRMGGAYENIGSEASVEATDDANCVGYKNPGFLKHGDEVLVFNSIMTICLPSGVICPPIHAWVDLDFPVANGNNGKDPYLNLNCDAYWEFQLRGDVSSPNCMSRAFNGTDITTNINSNMIENESVIYLPKSNVLNYFLTPYIAPDVTTGTVQEKYIKTFCNLFGSDIPSGNPTIFGTDYLNNGDRGFGLSTVQNYYIDDLFDLSNPIPLKKFERNGNTFTIQITDEEYQKSERLRSALNNNVDNIFGATLQSGFFLLGHKVNNQGNIEDVYNLPTYPYNIDVGSTYEKNLKFYGLTIPSDNTVTCHNTFRLINRNGLELNFLSGNKLKVIRSGNRNMLTAKEGQVVSTSYPLEIVNGKFIGIRDPSAGVEILQLSYSEYSEENPIKHSYEDVGANKFLKGTDGNFKIQKVKECNNIRYQNNYFVENAKDGYFEYTPLLWEAENIDCYFGIESLQTIGQGWKTQEEVLSYDEEGNTLDALNEFGINSSVLINPHSKVEAVASNTAQRNITVESFENYSRLIYERIWQEHFKTLSTSSTHNFTLGGVQYGIQTGASTHQQMLVKGEAHTGNYSLFLAGSDADYTDPITFTYMEKPLQTLVEIEIGDDPLPSTKTVSITKQDYIDLRTAPDGYENKYIQKQKPALQAEMSSALLSGINRHTINVYSFSNWYPDAGTYHFSVWMKELLPTSLPYHGTSPKVEISVIGSVLGQTQTFKAGSKKINGWYRISGEFSISEAIMTDPPTYPTVTITLDGGLWGAFFDDLRIHPVKSNMQTYVYDQITGHLKAQLDENNYATFYEYDDEGIPVQVKKETPAGVLTVSESRQSKHNHPQTWP